MSSYSPDAGQSLRRVFIRGLDLQARLGIYPHEEKPQRVIIDIELSVRDDAAPYGVGADRLDRVVDYEAVVNNARAIATGEHVRLAETLAERIAIGALADSRVLAAKVTVAKPEAFRDVQAVGVTVERIRAR